MIVTSEFLQNLKKAKGINLYHKTSEDFTTITLTLDTQPVNYLNYHSNVPGVDNHSGYGLDGQTVTKRQPSTYFGSLFYLNSKPGKTLVNALRKGDRLQAIWIIGNDNQFMQAEGFTCDECHIDVYRLSTNGKERFIGRFLIDSVTTKVNSLGLLGR